MDRNHALKEANQIARQADVLAKQAAQAGNPAGAAYCERHAAKMRRLARRIEAEGLAAFAPSPKQAQAFAERDQRLRGLRAA